MLFRSFLGKDFGKAKEHSETTQVEIDREVRRILDEQYQVAKKIVSDNAETLHRLAKALLEKETLNSDEIDRILRGECITSDPHAAPPASGVGGDAKLCAKQSSEISVTA